MTKVFTSLKAARKGLKLPGGQNAEVREWDGEESYYWSKRGGYADKVFAKLHESITKMKWRSRKETHTGTPDGYHDTFGTVFEKNGWTLSYSKHYGSTRYDNWYSIRLEKSK